MWSVVASIHGAITGPRFGWPKFAFLGRGCVRVELQSYFFPDLSELYLLEFEYKCSCTRLVAFLVILECTCAAHSREVCMDLSCSQLVNLNPNSTTPINCLVVAKQSSTFAVHQSYNLVSYILINPILQTFIKQVQSCGFHI
jgi:hypothetical protein